MGTGSVGPFLDNTKVNTYFSHDAGLTWREVRKGSWIYEIGDHGGLLVMAQDQVPTNYILYSWNEGATWNKLQITADDMHWDIDNIIIEPTSTSQRFVVYGTRTA